VSNATDLIEERLLQIEKTKDRWIKYSLGEYAVQLLEDRLREPQTHRMRNIAIVAETNSGITTIAERLLRRHPAEVHLASPSVVPILKVEATRADEDRFYNKILEQLPVYKARDTLRTSMKEVKVIRALRDCSVRMLIIDEFHNLMRASSGKQRDFLIVVKTLGNELRIPIVVLGLPEVYNALQSDPQLANRFQFVFLPKWQLDDEEHSDEPSEYRKFLAAFERELPFAASSELGDNPMAPEIFRLSEGTIGEATDLVRDAARHAIRNGDDRISIRNLRECGYITPSLRAFPPPLDGGSR
jgi:hypothetical protein